MVADDVAYEREHEEILAWMSGKKPEQPAWYFYPIPPPSPSPPNLPFWHGDHD